MRHRRPVPVNRSSMPPARPDLRRRAVRLAAATAALVLLPKCLLCAAAYAGLGAALGGASSELCGAAATTLPAGWPEWLGAAAALFAIALRFASGCGAFRQRWSGGAAAGNQAEQPSGAARG